MISKDKKHNETKRFWRKERKISILGLTLALALSAFSLPASSVAQSSPSLPGEPVETSNTIPQQSLPANTAPIQDLGQLAEIQTPEDIESRIREDAFDAALQGLLPLQPLEIRKLLERFDRTQESVEVPVYPDPKPEVTVEPLSLDPGSAPAVVKTAYGHVTTLNMLDLSGEPWPIQDISWAGNFEIIEAGAEEGAHILRISPQSEFATGNISIRMLELNTPIIMRIETSRDIVHYRFDAIVPDYGPKANAPLIDNGVLSQVSTGGEHGKKVASVLAGMMPADGVKLKVTGVDGRTSAFRVNDTTYVRTPLTLLSPGWSSSAASADGTRVYEIENTPVLLLSDRGKVVRARLSEREELIQ